MLKPGLSGAGTRENARVHRCVKPTPRCYFAQVTALAAGRLEETAERDTLLVGSQTNLLAYDVENNADIYFKVRSAHPGVTRT